MKESLLLLRNVLDFSRKNIYKYITVISKNIYIDKLDDIVNKSGNTYHRIIKMNLIDVKTSTYIEYGVEYNDKDPKLKLAIM